MKFRFGSVIAMVIVALAAVVGYIRLSGQHSAHEAENSASTDTESTAHPTRGAIAAQKSTTAAAASSPSTGATTAPVRFAAAPHRSPELVLPHGSPATWLPDLKNAASRGDASAAFVLFSVLADCAQFNSSVATRSSAAASDPSNTALLASLDQKNAETAARCEGISSDDVQERLRWLDAAAAGGDERAKVEYAGEALTAVLERPEVVVRNPDEINRVKFDGMRYLSEAAVTGNVTALMRLGFAYQNDILVPRDPELAYAYMYAADLTGLVQASPLLQKWGVSLSPEQRARAESFGRQVLGR